MAVRSGRLGRGVAISLALFLVPALTGCTATPQTTLVPRSDFAQQIQDLFELILVFAVLVFVVVEGALIYAIVRFRRKPGQGLPPQTHGNQRLEVAWTIAPAIILVVIAVPTVGTIFATQRPPAPDALQVQVIGHQWWWEFRYPELNIVTANELHVPVGRPISLSMESADVIHSFWAPQLGGKRDVFPKRVTRLSFTANQPGIYLGQCAEFCGISHANMRLRVIVQPPEEFQAWVRARQAPIAPTTDVARKGAELFLSPQAGCAACHTIEGTQAKGLVGPNLSLMGRRTTVAAGMLDNTPENMAAWLRDPQAVKPGARMVLPKKLTEAEIAALVAYLESLK